ncbi:hypothetical protein AVEN_231941-1 [Araneus ventricosus]|uniref:Uncharacterized protein n=1 Tax=Araneus ventricosus TaxID=182803 RepID=A0A4Y2C382_ARAVE|nr:hypothetical protein AVEN_231941-1 [Araneus ventricosus]
MLKPFIYEHPPDAMTITPFHIQPLQLGRSVTRRSPTSLSTTDTPISYCAYLSPAFQPRTPPPPISSRDRPLPRVSMPVSFQHLWSGSPNGVKEVKLPTVQTFDRAAPFLNRISH